MTQKQDDIDRFKAEIMNSMKNGFNDRIGYKHVVAIATLDRQADEVNKCLSEIANDIDCEFDIKKTATGFKRVIFTKK